MPEPKALLEGINSAMKELGSVHLEGELLVREGKGAEGELISARVEGDGESSGNLQLAIEMRVNTGPLGGTLSFETREVDGVSYAQNPLTGEWEISQRGVPLLSEAAEIALTGRLSLEYATVETDFLEGLPVYRVAGSAPDFRGAEHIAVWVGMDDMLVRQIQMEGSIPAREYAGLIPPDIKELHQRILFKLSHLDQPVKIMAPQLRPTPPPAPAPTLIPGPFGTMALYESAQYQFSIQYPAQWTARPGIRLLGETASFFSEQGEQLFIAEEDLVARGLGQATLEEYVDEVLSVLLAGFPDLQLVSREPVVTQQGRPAEVLEFTGRAGLLKASRLVYLHEGKIGFNATYLAPTAQHEDLEPLIAFSFSTLSD